MIADANDEELRKEIAYKVLEYYKGTADPKLVRQMTDTIYDFIKKFVL
jgi:hypothetical protein